MPHEPKKRHSRARQGKRRASIHLKLGAISICKNCGSPIVSHTVCKACGYYKGKEVISKKTKKSKEEQKALPNGNQEETK